MEDDATIFLKNLTATLPLLNFDDERKPNLKMPSMLNVWEYGTHYGLNGHGAKRLKCPTSGHCNRHALPCSRRVYVRPHILPHDPSSVASGQQTRPPPPPVAYHRSLKPVPYLAPAALSTWLLKWSWLNSAVLSSWISTEKFWKGYKQGNLIYKDETWVTYWSCSTVRISFQKSYVSPPTLSIIYVFKLISMTSGSQ